MILIIAIFASFKNSSKIVVLSKNKNFCGILLSLIQRFILAKKNFRGYRHFKGFVKRSNVDHF